MHDDPRSPAPPPRPSWRRGWTYTLARCALLIGTLALLGGGGLWWLLHHVAPPWFVPRVVFEWLVATVAPYAAWVGAALGVVVGFFGSIGVVILDARRGRLSKVR